METDVLRRDEHTAMQKDPALHRTAEVLDQNLVSRQAKGGLQRLRHRRLPVYRQPLTEASIVPHAGATADALGAEASWGTFRRGIKC